MPNLQLERIVLVYEEALDEGGLPIADGLAVEGVLLGGAPVDLDVLIGVVQHDVGIGLGDGQRADLLLGGPARRDGGHGPGLEADLHVGHVGLTGMDGAAQAVHATRLAIHQPQHDVDVMDHEIHDHGVVLHPGYERPEAARLDEDGLLHDLAKLLDGAVEALHVADVEDPPVLAGHAEELLGLFQRRGHRFLHEDVHAGLQEIAGDLEVAVGGDGHRGDVDQTREVAMARHRTCPVLPGDLVGPLGVRVADGDEVHVPQLGEGQDVILPHVPCPYHAGPQPAVLRCAYHTRSSLSGSSRPGSARCAPGMMPRWEPSTKATSLATMGSPPSSILMRAMAVPGASPER